MKSRPTAVAAIVAAALLGSGCAKLAAPSIDYAGPTPSLDLHASATDGLFSHFKGPLTVSALSLQHAGPAAPVISAAAAGSRGGSTTVRLVAAPSFSVGDVVSVTWSGTVTPLLGAPTTLTQTTQYRILTASLVVQAFPARLAPQQSGKVCVALLPNSPGEVTVRLASSAVAVTPATLHIAAAQPKAAATATSSGGEFSCPLPAAGAGAAARASGVHCDASDGVTATTTLGGLTIHGCSNIARSCCGIGGENCSAPAPVVSLCP